MEDKNPLANQPQDKKAELEPQKTVFSLNELDELRNKLAKQQMQIKDALKKMNEMKEKNKANEKKAEEVRKNK